MTIPFNAFWKGVREAIDKTWGPETLTAWKDSSLAIWQFFTQNKSANLSEQFSRTTSSRVVNKSWDTDTLTASKTGSKQETNYPDNFQATVQSPPDCPDTYLEWDNGGNSTSTLYIQRYTSGSWEDVVTSLSAGTENYTDTGVTEADTDNFRIKFNETGAAWVETGYVDTVCPI